MRVLGIESSCDESAVAVLDDREGLLAHRLFSQTELHDAYGGVVPELASRDHVRRLLPLLKEALQEAASKPADIDGIAYTAGPGLAGALLTGATLGRSLAYAWDVPAVSSSPPGGTPLCSAPGATGPRASVPGTARFRRTYDAH